MFFDGTWLELEVDRLEVVQLNISLYRIASFSLPTMVFHCFASLGSVGLSSTGPDESTGSGHDLYVARKKNNFGIIVYISHLLYFHNRARWAIKVIICPFRGTREI